MKIITTLKLRTVKEKFNFIKDIKRRIKNKVEENKTKLHNYGIVSKTFKYSMLNEIIKGVLEY